MTIKANAARVLSMLAVLALSVGMIAGLSLTASAADDGGTSTTTASTVWTADFSGVTEANKKPVTSGLTYADPEGAFVVDTQDGETGLKKQSTAGNQTGYLKFAVADETAVGKNTPYFRITARVYVPEGTKTLKLQYNAAYPDVITVNAMYKVTRDSETKEITRLEEATNVAFSYDNLPKLEGGIQKTGASKTAWKNEGKIRQVDSTDAPLTYRGNDGNEYTPISTGSNNNSTGTEYTGLQFRKGYYDLYDANQTLSKTGWQDVTYTLTDAYFRENQFRINFRLTMTDTAGVIVNKVTVEKVSASDLLTMSADYSDMAETTSVTVSTQPALNQFSKVFYEHADGFNVVKPDDSGVSGLKNVSEGYAYWYPKETDAFYSALKEQNARIVFEAVVYSDKAQTFKIQYNDTVKTEQTGTDAEVSQDVTLTAEGWQTVRLVATNVQILRKKNNYTNFRVCWAGTDFVLSKFTVTVDDGYATANSLLAMNPEKSTATDDQWSAYTTAKTALQTAVDSNKLNVWDEVNALNAAMQELPSYYYTSLASASTAYVERLVDTKNESGEAVVHYISNSWNASSILSSKNTTPTKENAQGTSEKASTFYWESFDDGRAGVTVGQDSANLSYVYLTNRVFLGSKVDSTGKVTRAETIEHAQFMADNNGKLLKVTVVAKAQSTANLVLEFGENSIPTAWKTGGIPVTKTDSLSSADWQTYTIYVPIVDHSSTQEKEGDVLTGVDSLTGINNAGGRISVKQGVTVESIAMQVVDPATVLQNATTASVTLSENLALNVKLDASALNAFGDITIASTTNGTDADNREVTVTATMGENKAEKTQKVSDWRTDSTLTFDNIRPDQMGEEIKIKVTVAKSGNNPDAEWSTDISIAEYMHKLIDDTTNSDATKNLAAAALKYGIAAREYVQAIDSTVTTTEIQPDTKRDLTEANKPSATYNITGDKTGATWYSASLVLTDGVSIRLKFNGGTGKTYTVNDVTAKTTDTVGVYTVDIPVNPDKYNDNMDFVVKEGETAVSNTLTYSVAAYANAKWDSTTNSELSALVQALMTYGKYAKAYTTA